VLVGEEHGARAAGELPGVRPDHFLEEAVAALDGARAHEGDADRGVVENELLLGERPLERLVGPLSFGDVLEEPDVALGGIAGLDRPSADPAPEPRAILPAHPGLARMGAPAVELGIDAAGPLPFVVGKETLARGDAHHGAGRVAEHLLEAAIAAHGPPVTGNLDPDHH